MNPKVDHFLKLAKKWKAEMTQLREIILQNKELQENYKWMHPCYTFRNKNVVLIHGFKDYCALLFHKGSLLEDPEGILIQQTENVQAARQIRFTSVTEIEKLKPVMKQYIRAAVELERQGKKVVLKETADYPVPEEFSNQLKLDTALQKAFHALTPGRQRAYLYYFSQAKQSKTRESRIEKYYTKILEGKGIDD